MLHVFTDPNTNAADSRQPDLGRRGLKLLTDVKKGQCLGYFRPKNGDKKNRYTTIDQNSYCFKLNKTKV